MSTDRPSAMNWGATPAAAPRMYQDYMVPAMFEALTMRMLARLERRPACACWTSPAAPGCSRALAQSGAPLRPGSIWRRRCSRSHAKLSPDLELIEASADAIPFGDDDFDAATCQQGLQFFPNRRLALTQIRRVVKPGGKVVVACWCDPNQGALGAIARVLTKHAGEEAGAMMLAPFVINRESDLHGLMEEVGFTDVSVERETIEARFTDPDEFAQRVIMAGPIAARFLEEPEDVRHAITAEVTHEIADMRQGDQLVFPMPTLIAVASA